MPTHSSFVDIFNVFNIFSHVHSDYNRLFYRALLSTYWICRHIQHTSTNSTSLAYSTYAVIYIPIWLQHNIWLQHKAALCVLIYIVWTCDCNTQSHPSDCNTKQLCVCSCIFSFSLHTLVHTFTHTSDCNIMQSFWLQHAATRGNRCFGGNVSMEDIRGSVTAVAGEGGPSSAWAKEVCLPIYLYLSICVYRVYICLHLSTSVYMWVRWQVKIDSNRFSSIRAQEVCFCIYLHLSASVYIYVHLYASVYIYLCVCLHLSTSMYICMHLSTSIYVFV